MGNNEPSKFQKNTRIAKSMMKQTLKVFETRKITSQV